MASASSRARNGMIFANRRAVIACLTLPFDPDLYHFSLAAHLLVFCYNLLRPWLRRLVRALTFFTLIVASPIFTTTL